MQLSKAKQKLIRSLHRKKQRLKYNKFLAEGDKIVREALASPSVRVDLVVALPEWIGAHREDLPPEEERLAQVDPATLRSLSCLNTPNQVLAVIEMARPRVDWAGLREEFAIYLDGIRDPGNMGAILRVADWFGMPWVLASPDCVEGYNPKVVQASMGAVLRVGQAVATLDEVTAAVPGWPLIGAALDGESLYEASLPGSGLLIIGNESEGLRPETMEKLDLSYAIPRHVRGGAESLNAAVAAGIFAAFLRRGDA